MNGGQVPELAHHGSLDGGDVRLAAGQADLHRVPKQLGEPKQVTAYIICKRWGGGIFFIIKKKSPVNGRYM
jgi:hypothetical protein